MVPDKALEQTDSGIFVSLQWCSQKKICEQKPLSRQTLHKQDHLYNMSVSRCKIWLCVSFRRNRYVSPLQFYLAPDKLVVQKLHKHQSNLPGLSLQSYLVYRIRNDNCLFVVELCVVLLFLFFRPPFVYRSF